MHKHDHAKADIEIRNNEFMAALRNRDKRAFVALYAPDAILLLPNMGTLEGHEGAEAFFHSFEKRGIAEVRLTSHEVESHGEMAWERGASEALRPDGTPLGRGSYMVIWKRSASGWVIYRDIVTPAA